MSPAEISAPTSREIVSREAELVALSHFLDEARSPSCFVISGTAGIGKTTLWEAGVEAARTRGRRVLTARTSEAEVALSFAAIADLLAGVDPEVFDALPAPQRLALDVALRRRDPAETGADPFAISAGFLGALTVVTERAPLLVAVDDAQWLDAPSADALAFAARRLPADRTRFLLTRRHGRRPGIERALRPSLVERLEVPALSFGATSRVVSDQFGTALGRRHLRQVYETSQGNPLFALELARLLVAGGPLGAGAEMPMPEMVDDVFGSRVRGLSAPVRRALLAVALSAGLTPTEVSELGDVEALEDAVTAGVLVVDGSTVRPTHPMLAAAARHQSGARQRRELHRDLAKVVGDLTLRARHRAISTVAPDEEVARAAAEAASVAAARGAVLDAEELGAHALRLTPVGASQRAERLLALGGYYARADEMARVTGLLTSRMDELPPGRSRALAHLLLGDAGDVPGEEIHLAHALAEAGEDPVVRSLALAKQSRLLSMSAAERIDEAETLALEAQSVARGADAAVADRVGTSLAWARVLRGRPVDDPASDVSAAPPSLSPPESRLDSQRAARLVYRGDLPAGRTIFARLLREADERGDQQTIRHRLQQLCELETRAGNVAEARRLLSDLEGGPAWMHKVIARLHAVLAAVIGDRSTTARFAAVVFDEHSGFVQGWDRLEATRALGTAALLERDVATAVQCLGAVWDHTKRELVDEPGAFPVAPDLVEALVAVGDAAAARKVVERLRRLSIDQQHPWGLVSARRGAAAVALATQYTDKSARTLGDAADEYGSLGLGFERARTWLFLGERQRRARQRAEARHSLEMAVADFVQLGCAGWAAHSRTELDRVSGRRPTAEGQLTPSERQVADLAASGASNKEIATRLFVSVYTVEAHLTHTYAKLGVRSRAQLARLLHSAPEANGTS
ncbi:MAG: AAA family ATPase [Acidimicrobiales bacterium]